MHAQPEVSVQTISQVLSVLSALHKGGFAHRNIKPSNILQSCRQELWTLSDFAACAAIGAPSEDNSNKLFWFLFSTTQRIRHIKRAYEFPCVCHCIFRACKEACMPCLQLHMHFHACHHAYDTIGTAENSNDISGLCISCCTSALSTGSWDQGLQCCVCNTWSVSHKQHNQASPH